MSVIQSNIASNIATAALEHHLYAAFVAALPKILNVADYRFRRIPCPDTREDRVCETVALCWVWFVRLVQRGRNPERFMTALANYGAKAVHSGRRAVGLEKAKDVLSRRCRRRRGFDVSALPAEGAAERPEIDDALHDNTQTPVPDQVQFRCDFPAWKSRFPVKKRQLIDQLALGHRTKDLAAMFRLSEARISQLRKEFHDDYTAFCDDCRD
jgi:hypothetical protein